MAQHTPAMSESGKRPGRGAGPLSNARLAILALLGAEIMFFAGLIGAYLVFRLGSITWPPPSQIDIRLPRAVTGVNTAILLLSGYTMFQAIRAIRNDRSKELRNWLFVTAILGSVFLAVQGSEWVRLVRHGFTLSAGIYSSIFYVVIGCHALHVLAAVAWVLIVLSIAAKKRFSASRHAGVEVCAVYWGFVVALWPFLYLLVYLL